MNGQAIMRTDAGKHACHSAWPCSEGGHADRMPVWAFLPGKVELDCLSLSSLKARIAGLARLCIRHQACTFGASHCLELSAAYSCKPSHALANILAKHE